MNNELKTGLEIRRLLDDSADELPAHVRQTLDASIALAVKTHAESSTTRPVANTGGWSAGNGIKEWLDGFTRPALSVAFSAVFMAAAGFGVYQELQKQNEASILALAELDAAILADDLPADAWLDEGFINYSFELQQSPEATDERIQQWLEQLNQEQPST